MNIKRHRRIQTVYIHTKYRDSMYSPTLFVRRRLLYLKLYLKLCWPRPFLHLPSRITHCYIHIHPHPSTSIHIIPPRLIFPSTTIRPRGRGPTKTRPCCSALLTYMSTNLPTCLESSSLFPSHRHREYHPYRLAHPLGVQSTYLLFNVGQH